MRLCSSRSTGGGYPGAGIEVADGVEEGVGVVELEGAGSGSASVAVGWLPVNQSL